MRIRLLTLMFLGLALPAFAGTAPPGGARPVLAPAFTLPTRDGSSVSLDSLRGKVVFVDFWASWCAPCRKSFPWLATLHERYAPKGLRIVAINLDKKSAAAYAFLDGSPAPFVIAFDPDGKTPEAYKVVAMPSSFLISPTGTVLYSHAGFDPKEKEVIEKLIQQECSQ